MTYLLLAILPLSFALAVAIKGGWVGKFWKDCPSWVDNHVPPVIIALSISLFFSWEHTLACFIASYVYKLSMGEEGGAIINNIGNNQYIDNPDDFGREFGIKKGIQRGITDGAAFALALWSPIMIVAGLFFVPIYWLMSKLKHKITGQNDWAWAEPTYGFVFGVCAIFAFMLS